MSIEQAIKEVGLNVIAKRMGESAQCVSNWRTRGIPERAVLAFCRAAEWKVTPHEVHPEIYPNPTDGLPAEHNKAAA